MAKHPLLEEDPRFAPYSLLKGGNWRMYLNSGDQRYLGRSYLWLCSRHVDRMLFHDLSPLERNELFNLSRRFWKALNALGWAPSLLNECWLGNEVSVHGGHGHLHLIPRYEAPPVFRGRSFPDHQWGRNYAPHEKLVLPYEEVLLIRDALRDALSRIR